MEKCISIKDLKAKVVDNQPVAIIDVRNRDEYDAQHIPNAINIPLDQLEKIMPFLNCNKFYVTVCGKGGGRSEQGANILSSAGLNSSWLCGGTFGWFE
jgi:rhodanese-related sulfurtransferase